jgi:hypothetical protein
MDENRRDRDRVPMPSPVHGEVMVYHPMTILDIGTGGLRIETSFALQIDSLHDFRISLGERSIVVKGRIVHCHIGELTEGVVLYRSGVELVDTSDHAQSTIEVFVDALRLSRPATSSIVDGQITE